jgi:hypothetical protein
MTYQELKEEIAKMIFHQTTMEHDWELRKDWVKDTYRKDTDELFKLISDAGWEIVPKNPSRSEK